MRVARYAGISCAKVKAARTWIFSVCVAVNSFGWSLPKQIQNVLRQTIQSVYIFGCRKNGTEQASLLATNDAFKKIIIVNRSNLSGYNGNGIELLLRHARDVRQADAQDWVCRVRLSFSHTAAYLFEYVV